jgi:hypothetical protein
MIKNSKVRKQLEIEDVNKIRRNWMLKTGVMRVSSDARRKSNSTWLPSPLHPDATHLEP